MGWSRLRWKPPSLLRTLQSYSKSWFPWLPSGNTCQIWSSCDPDYGTLSRVDMLLEGKVFSKTVLHGQQFGLTGMLSVFKMCFSYVLNGNLKAKLDALQTPAVMLFAIINQSKCPPGIIPAGINERPVVINKVLLEQEQRLRRWEMLGFNRQIVCTRISIRRYFLW